MTNKRNKPNKKMYYSTERENFIIQLNSLLGLSDDNNTVNYDFLITDLTIKQFIQDNEDNIKKIYKYGKWGYFRHQSKKDIPSLIKQIYKEHNYNIFSKKIKNNTTVKRTTFLFFFKDGDVIHFDN